MPVKHTPDRDLGWRGEVYPAGQVAFLPDDLAIALGLTLDMQRPDGVPLRDPEILDSRILENDPTVPDLRLEAAVARLAELEAIFDPDGDRDWQAIKEIGDSLGVKKHPDGWDSSFLRIIEAEFGAAIAQALEVEE
jgi:hypothetical protein